MKKNSADMSSKINLGFWQKVREDAAAERRPIFVMAPLADVTDAAFRQIIAKYSRMNEKVKTGKGGPDALWTEFVSADGLCSQGRKILLRDLTFSRGEHPIVAQLFSSRSEKMREAAALVASLGFDGLDINMGCPDRGIEKQGCGAAMIKDPEKAIAIIEAAREGIKSAKADTSLGELLGEPSGRVLGMGNQGPARKENVSAGAASDTVTFSSAAELASRNRTSPSDLPGEKQVYSARTVSARSNSPRPVESSAPGAPYIPVSVKTRIGYNKIDLNWIRILLEQKLPVLTVHLRTRKEMSEVPAHWELMPEIVKMRDEISPETLIIGNGDATDLGDATKKWKESGCDGIMFGRAIFGNPWLFDRARTEPVSTKEKLKVMLEHTELFEKLLGDIKSFAIMKKHYKAYVNGWDGAKELRMKLMEAASVAEVKEIVERSLR